MAHPVRLREPTFFTPLAERACEWEADGGFWKAASYALRFFALIGSFLSFIGIPFYILADREITLESFENDLHAGGFIANPQAMEDLRQQVAQVSQERDAQMQLVAQAQGDLARMAGENLRIGTDIQGLEAEKAELTQTVEQQAQQLEEAAAALDKILGERVDEHREREVEKQDIAQLFQEFNTYKQSMREKLVAIKAAFAEASLMSPQKKQRQIAQIHAAIPVTPAK